MVERRTLSAELQVINAFLSTNNNFLPYISITTTPLILSVMSPSVSALFQPLRVGTTDLQHRTAIAPLTCLRTNKEHVHVELANYAQRSSEPGTLRMSEAIFIAPQAAGYANVPGTWNALQFTGWKTVRVSPRPNYYSVHSHFARRSRTPFMPMGPTFSSNFGLLDAPSTLLYSSRKAATILSLLAPSRLLLLETANSSFRAPRSSENTSNCTPRQQTTLSMLASTTSRYAERTTISWTSF
jgi:hypothetical protein